MPLARQRFFLSICWLLCLSPLQSQTGPGGVGDTSTTTGLLLWLRADRGLTGLPTSHQVQSWQDQSQSHHLFTPGENTPTWHFDGGEDFGGFPCLEFTAGQQLIGPTLPPTGAYTLYTVGRPDRFPATWLQAGTQAGNTWASTLSDSGVVQSRLEQGGAYVSHAFSDLLSPVRSPQLLWSSWDGSSLLAGLDEHSSAVSGSSPGAMQLPDQGCLVGGDGDLHPWFEGQIAEIIAFDAAHNRVQRRLVTNYLQARYGPALSIPFDIYEAPVPLTYRRQVAGIGYDQGHLHAVAQSGALTIKSEVGNGHYLQSNGDYLMMGLNQTPLAWTNMHLPKPQYRRWDADWYLDFTDQATQGGKLTLSFTYAQVPDTLMGQHVLLFRAPGTENYTVRSWAAQRDSLGIHFALDEASYADGFYTLGLYQTPTRGQAWQMNGGQQKVQIQDIPWPTAAGTISCWYQATGFGNGRTALLGGYAGGEARAPGFMSPGGLLHWEFGSMAMRATSQWLQPEKWYHIAMTYTKHDAVYDLQLYLNGLLVDKAQSIAAPDGLPATWDIGHYYSSPDQVDGAEGFLDEVQIWHTAQSAEEIQAGMCQLPSRDHELIAYFNFEASAGPFVQNIAGLGRGLAANVPRPASTAPVGFISRAAYPQGQDWTEQILALPLSAAEQIALTHIEGYPIGLHLYALTDSLPQETSQTAYEIPGTAQQYGLHVVGNQPATGQLQIYYDAAQAAIAPMAPDSRRLMSLPPAAAQWHHSGASHDKAQHQFIWQGLLQEQLWTIGTRLDRQEAQPGAGLALQFDGTNAYIRTNAAFSAQADSSFTLEAWLEFPYLGQGAQQIIWGSHAANAPFELSLTADHQLSLRHKEAHLIPALEVAPNQWLHIAYSFDGQLGQGRLWANGLEIGTVTVAPSGTDLGRLQIGRSGQMEQAFFRGKIDELRLWHQALAPTELRNWMCRRISGAHPDFIQLAHYYPMDEDGNGLALEDRKGSQDGQMQGYTDQRRVASGAPVGDISVAQYSAAPQQLQLKLAHRAGDAMWVDTWAANAPVQGAHLYLVDEPSNGLSAEKLVQWQHSRYWGVFVVGEAAPYRATVSYAGYPDIGTESGLSLAARTNSSQRIWTNAFAFLDEQADTVSLLGSGSAEYMLGEGIPFAVQWLRFTAQATNTGVALEWHTAWEKEAHHYRVERSWDGAAFEAIAELMADGDRPIPGSYTFADAQWAASDYPSAYYRIAQIGIDGRTLHSEVREVPLLAAPLAAQIKANPFTDVIEIILPAGRETFIEAEVLDTVGRSLGKWAIPATQYRLIIAAQKWPMGRYHLHLRYKDQFRHFSLQKQ